MGKARIWRDDITERSDPVLLDHFLHILKEIENFTLEKQNNIFEIIATSF